MNDKCMGYHRHDNLDLYLIEDENTGEFGLVMLCVDWHDIRHRPAAPYLMFKRISTDETMVKC